MQHLGADNINSSLLSILMPIRIFSFMCFVLSCFLFAAIVFLSCIYFFASFRPFIISLLLFIVVMDRLHASTPSASFSSRDGSPYTIMKYITQYGHSLGSRLIGAMLIVGDQPSIHDRQYGMYGDTVSLV